MEDQWGNEIRMTTSETDWVFTRGGNIVNFPLSMTREDASARALNAFNGMQADDGEGP